MLKLKLFLISILFLNFCSQSTAQQTVTPTKLTGFIAPLNISPPALAGSFGELRANHFHSGLDFKTNQQIGYPVFAVEDGYVTRVRIQNSGFGLALYVNHPNGLTSVYAHLSRFNPKIGQFAKSIQYKKQVYEIDEFVSRELLPVRKGDLIGYSGNTGSSGGPHLHFEIRDTKTEQTINPQLLGLEIPDKTPPVIHSMYVYRLNGKAFNEFTPKQYFQVVGDKGKYNLNKVNTINLNGEVGFGIVTTDKHDGNSGINGVYAIQLEVDENIIFSSAVEKFGFEQTRALNSHIDYPALIKQKTYIQKSFVDPGNPLQIYSNLINNGRINFNDGGLHKVKYTITDAKGNSSILQFNVQANSNAVINTPVATSSTVFAYNKANEFSNANVKVIIPKGTLYNDLNFSYQQLPKPQSNAFSDVHQIQNQLTPLHTGFEIWIKADSSLNKFKNKAVIVNTARVSQGGEFENGWVKAQPKKFGSFFIAIDTVPPKIIPINIANEKNMKGVSKISLKISDNLSGIKSFNGYIDGKWILMEFDAKSSNLWHSFDELTQPGKHSFELVVSDMKNNVNKYTILFYR